MPAAPPLPSSSHLPPLRPSPLLPARPPRPNPSATAAPAKTTAGPGGGNGGGMCCRLRRGRQPRSEGPGAAATPITASPVRRLANQAPVRSTNQKGRWRAGAEEKTERGRERRREEGPEDWKAGRGAAGAGRGATTCLRSAGEEPKENWAT